MRKILIVFALLSAVLCTAGQATAAFGPTLRAHHVTDQAITWLGLADAGTVAFTGRDGAVTTRADDGTSAAVPTPPGCERAQAAGGGRLAYGCGADIAVTSLNGDEVVRRALPAVPDPATCGGGVAATGAQWVKLTFGCYHGSDWSQQLNWRTGELRAPVGIGNYDDPAATTLTPTTPWHATSQYVDLDSPASTVPLCAPVKAAIADFPGFEPLPLPVTTRGRWVLVTTPAGSSLRRCGHARPVALPAAFASPVLGDGWVAQVVPLPHRSPEVRLVRLADDRRFQVVGRLGLHGAAPGSTGVVTLTRHRLYVFGDAGATGGDGRAGLVSTVILPKRVGAGY